MQPKVSIVIPCYNKEKYIASMFDSILAQEWDNIEVILVNDGSTDDSLKIVREYKEKLLTRGYEVKIITQENQGVAMAVRNGLLNISGEFVCQVDADDELEKNYISTMAGWLSENPYYDWTACDATIVRADSFSPFQAFPNGTEEDCNLEKWVANKICKAVWVYMIRTDYLKKCNVVELFYTGRESNQEAQFFFPLVLGGGKIKYFQKPLYLYNRRESTTHRIYRGSYENAKKRWTESIVTFEKVLFSLPVENHEKQKLNAISQIQLCTELIKDALVYGSYPQYIKDSVDLLSSYIRKYFNGFELVDIENTYKYCYPLCNAVIDNILGMKPKKLKKSEGRVIAWGVMGRNGKCLPSLDGTILEPTELWDAAGDNTTIKKPMPESLTPDDLVLVIPMWSGDIIDALGKLSFYNYLLIDDVMTHVAARVFPEFYDSSISFLLK